MLKKLSSDDKGKIYLANMYFCYKEKLICQDKFKEYLQCCNTEYGNASLISADVLINMMSNIAENMELYLGCINEVNIIPEQLARVIKAHDFIDSNFGLLIGAGMPDKSEYTQSDWIDFKEQYKRDKASGKNYIRGGATLRGGMPFAWVTDKTALDGKTEATSIRDFLGLTHFGPDEHIILIYYPIVTDGVTIKRPTFYDAGSHSRFGARYDNEACDYADGCGRAVDMKKLSTASKCIEGGKELVIQELPFSEEYDWDYVGKILCGVSDISDDEFLNFLGGQDYIEKAVSELSQLI